MAAIKIKPEVKIMEEYEQEWDHFMDIKSGPNQEGLLDGITKKLMANSTMDRTLVLDNFMEWASVVQRACNWDDFEALAENLDDPLQQLVIGLYRDLDSLGPDVQLCEKNRVDMETLYYDLHTRLDGKFLLCRTISKAVNGAWLEVVVEDPRGQNAAILQLKNFTPTKYSMAISAVTWDAVGDGKAWFQWLPQGSYIAVKNAFASVARGLRPAAPVMICCNNPADVELLSPKTIRAVFPGLVWKGSDYEESFWNNTGNTEAEIMENLKRNGNTAFVFKRYTDALRWYDLAREYAVGHDTLVNIWSNKAAACLGLGCFLRALKFCDQVLLLDPIHVKTIFRKVKALIGLGRSGEAAAFLKNKLNSEHSLMSNYELHGLGHKIPPSDYPEDETAPTLAPCVTQYRCDKLNTADADFDPEYVGPIECRPSTICRGVFATEDIPSGRLITLLRGFATVIEPHTNVIEPHTWVINKNIVEAELVEIIANKVAFSGRLGKDIYKLWAGKKLKFVDENDASLNLKVDIARIRKIVARNTMFVFNRCAAIVSTIGAQIYHSCVDTNVEATQINSSLIVRATKFIEKGEQLVMSLLDEPVVPFEIRKLSLKKFGLTCNCRLCQYEGQRDAMTLNKFENLCYEMRMVSGLDNQSSNPFLKISVNLALAILAELEGMYVDAPDLNMMLLDRSISNLLCDALIALGSYRRLAALCERIFAVAEAVGNTNKAITAATNAIRGYLKWKMKRKAKEWFLKADKWSLAARELLTWSNTDIHEMAECGILLLVKSEDQVNTYSKVYRLL